MRSVLLAALIAGLASPAAAACYVPAAVGAPAAQIANQTAVMLCQQDELKTMADIQVRQLQLDEQLRQQQALLEQQLLQQQQLAALTATTMP